MPTESAHTSLTRVQGGTGKHIDGSVLEPLMTRPFQSLVMLSDATASPSAGTSEDGSLRVLPGMHAQATIL